MVFARSRMGNTKARLDARPVLASQSSGNLSREFLVRRSLLLLFALLLSSCAPRENETEVWLIGLDAADWDLLDPMIERGLLPNLAALKAEGASGRLRSDEPMLSPILWTSIATGRTADVHGVTWFMMDGPDGEKQPVSSRHRRVRALWNLADEHGLRSGVIGWWATWPVDPVAGWMVSDYVAWHSFGITGQQTGVEGRVWPVELAAVVEASIPNPEAIGAAELSDFVELPLYRLEPSALVDTPYGDSILHLRQALATSRGYTDLAVELLDRDRPDWMGIYYEGTDAVSHLFGRYAPPRADWIAEDEYRAFGNTVEHYWRWQDARLGELLEKRRENTVVLVVSDHGFRTGEERRQEEEFAIETADASHMPDGIVLLAGPGVSAGARLRGADIYDIAPTVAWLLGLEVAEDLEGEVLRGAFTSQWLDEHPVRGVPTWDVGPFERGDFAGSDPDVEQMEEMLRSLGYISVSDGEVDVGIEGAVNRAIVLRGRGRLEEAEAELRTVLARDPANLSIRRNLAQVLGDRGEWTAAMAIYDGLLVSTPEDPTLYEDAAFAAARAGEVEAALNTLDRGLGVAPGDARLHATRAHALQSLGRMEEAGRALDTALEKDPREAVVYYYRGLWLRERGEFDAAMAAFDRAVALDPLHEQSALERIDLVATSGNLDAAVRYSDLALERCGEVPQLCLQRGALELGRRKPDLAYPWLLKADAQRPDDPAVLGNLGMAEAMRGDLAAAIRRFERVVELDPQAADAVAQLAMLVSASGDRRRAAELLERARAIDPTMPLPELR